MDEAREPEQPNCRVFLAALVVRPSDVDAARHLNHVAMLGFFEYGRVRAHRDARSERPDLPDMNTVVRHLGVSYFAQAALFEELAVRSWIRRDGRTSRTWAQELVRPDGVLVARAAVTSVLVDAATGRAAPLPAVYRDVFAPYREA